MGLLDRFFFPTEKRNVFTVERYIKDLESGVFRNKMNLGIQEHKNGSWRLKDFAKEPNAVFGGAMGSGKSKGMLFSAVTWMLANSDHTVMFITDTLKGAVDYKELFKYKKQVYTGFSEAKVHKIVDLLFDEIEERKNIFSKVEAEGINDYEKKAKAYKRKFPKDSMDIPDKMTRCILLMEEFHAVPYTVMNFDSEFKKPNTTASKFHKIMRVGRSYGVWVMAGSQKMTKSDIPSEVVPNLVNKQVFQVSSGESNYLLGSPAASQLRSDQKGRCVTDEGQVQFPLLTEKSQAKLLETYMKPLDASCAYLTDQLITDYLNGKSTEDLYKFKKLPDLVSGLSNFDENIVIRVLHKKMGHTVSMPPVDDVLNLCCLVDWKSQDSHIQRKVAVMVRIGAKLSPKHLKRLFKGMELYNCEKGIIYTNQENITKSLYAEAETLGIEIVDNEDLYGLAKRVESDYETNKFSNFEPDKLADDDKESGEYQKRTEEKSAYQKQRESEDLSFFNENFEEKPEPEIMTDEEKLQNDLELQSIREAGKAMQSRLTEELFPDIDETELESEEFDFPDNFQDIFINPEDNLKEKLEEEKPQEESLPEELEVKEDITEPLPKIEEVKEEEMKPTQEKEIPQKQDFFDSLMDSSPSVKKVKRPLAKPNFNMKSEDTASLLVHLQRNSEGEVYRCLFFVVSSLNQNSVIHKYYLDKNINSEFTQSEKTRLGVTTYRQWNELPEVMTDDEFEKRFKEYLHNFAVSEFPVKISCWEKDVSFIKERISGNAKFETPYSFERRVEDFYGFAPEDCQRKQVLNEFGIKDKEGFFSEIDKDLGVFTALE